MTDKIFRHAPSVFGERDTGHKARIVHGCLCCSHSAGGLVYKDTTFGRLSEVHRIFFGLLQSYDGPGAKKCLHFAGKRGPRDAKIHSACKKICSACRKFYKHCRFFRNGYVHSGVARQLPQMVYALTPAAKCSTQPVPASATSQVRFSPPPLARVPKRGSVFRAGCKPNRKASGAT